MSDHSFGGYSNPGVTTTASTNPPVEETKKRNTVYDAMRAELSKPATLEKEKVIPAGKGRPGWGLRVSTELDLDRLDTWRIRARKTKGKEAIDMARYNSLVIAAQTICLVYNGNDFLDEDDTPLGFSSQEVINMLNGMGDVHTAIKNFFVRDADILKVGAEILEACGYIEDEDDEDPLGLEQD